MKKAKMVAKSGFLFFAFDVNTDVIFSLTVINVPDTSLMSQQGTEIYLSTVTQLHLGSVLEFFLSH